MERLAFRTIGSGPPETVCIKMLRRLIWVGRRYSTLGLAKEKSVRQQIVTAAAQLTLKRLGQEQLRPWRKERCCASLA